MINERYKLSRNRIEEILKTQDVAETYKDYFESAAKLILMILEPKCTPEYNKNLYQELLPENYENSYANPTFCAKKFGNLNNVLTSVVNSKRLEKTGAEGVLTSEEQPNEKAKRCGGGYNISQMLCFVYSELYGLIPYAFEDEYYSKSVSRPVKRDEANADNTNSVNQDENKGTASAARCKEIITIYMELFVELYVMFEDALKFGKELGKEDYLCVPETDAVHDIIYWFISDNCDIISPFRIRQQLDPELDFATNIIMNANLTTNEAVTKLDSDGKNDVFDFSYLYQYGEYVTDNEIEVAKFLANLPQEDIDAMASTYTEGYRIGFVKAGKPLDKKTTVNIRYNLGFERIIKVAIKNFEKMGLRPVIYRAGTLSLVKNGVNKIGYVGAIPNKQYDYDHREDTALYLDKDFVNRKALVIKEAYECMKTLANGHAGPAVMEVFGEEPFSPETKKESLTLDVVGRKNQVDISDRLSQLTNEYIKGEERSFTIIAYPIPEIGDKFREIFSETVKLNTLDYKRYESMQQLIIDVLDRSKEVRIEGSGTNRTKLIVKTQKITDATKQTSFENCVADVNIPVGEVFTSPVLKGTNGILNVSEVYLFGLNYIDLSITFKDGMIVDYSCKNFDDEEENKKFIRDNLMHNHETLPLGEFAIGTNTTAYRMARDYGIEAKMPILIGEKTGPHFAVGDTCYSHEEDVKVYNPDGKEIIARDNELTKEYRRTNPSKAYFNCHTDITIPYDELAGIYAVLEDGSEIAIIEDGRFTLEGLEELNIPLDK